MNLASGTAGLHVAKVRDRSTVISSWARSPLSLLTPRPRGESVWAYTSNYGGGMVAGDETGLKVDIDEGARCFLSTQSSTKIYRNPAARVCAHRLDARLARGSLLILAPDPVQCFAESFYEQYQTLHLAAEANLVLVDWISSGRSARGERWAFRRYFSRNRVFQEGRLTILDSLLLDNESASIHNRFRTGRYNCLATVIIVGTLLGEVARQLNELVGQKPVVRNSDVVIAASPIGGGVILRMAGVQVEEVGRHIYNHLRFVPGLLQGDPWRRKW